MKLIVGLGNPGTQYEQTRHNVGFRVVDKLAEQLGWKWNERRSRAVLASGTIGTEKIILVKPLTFMNLSGESVGDLLRWYKLPAEDVLVVYDELDLPLGKVRLRQKGSAAGHNGLDSVIRHLHTNEFPRLRVGIGRPTNKRVDTMHYVLGVPPGDERIELDRSEDRALEAVHMLLTQGIEATMNTINVDPEAQRKAEEKRQRQQERQEQAKLRRLQNAPLPIAIGMNARLFPNNWRPAREEIAFAHARGFRYLQFPGPEQGLDIARLGDPIEKLAGALKAGGVTAVMEIPIRLHATGYTDAGATIVDILRANLPAITIFPCERVHLHLVATETLDNEQLRALETHVIPQFAEIVTLAETHHFIVGFEHNEPAVGPFATPEACAALLRAVPGLGFVWDVNHVKPEQQAGYLELTSRMTMLHISDTPLPEVNYHLPLGMGSIDLTACCEDLLQRDFHGPAILEIGGLPKSGGYGRDTDDALLDSYTRFRAAITKAMDAQKRET